MGYPLQIIFGAISCTFRATRNDICCFIFNQIIIFIDFIFLIYHFNKIICFGWFINSFCRIIIIFTYFYYFYANIIIFLNFLIDLLGEAQPINSTKAEPLFGLFAQQASLADANKPDNPSRAKLVWIILLNFTWSEASWWNLTMQIEDLLKRRKRSFLRYYARELRSLAYVGKAEGLAVGPTAVGRRPTALRP